jgi:hypothetical protein
MKASIQNVYLLPPSGRCVIDVRLSDVVWAQITTSIDCEAGHAMSLRLDTNMPPPPPGYPRFTPQEKDDAALIQAVHHALHLFASRYALLTQATLEVLHLSGGSS